MMGRLQLRYLGSGEGQDRAEESLYSLNGLRSTLNNYTLAIFLLAGCLSGILITCCYDTSRATGSTLRGIKL